LDKDWENLVKNLVNENILKTPSVINALLSVPRKLFLPKKLWSYSAFDNPLPIGFGQTVSAPHRLDFFPI